MKALNKRIYELWDVNSKNFSKTEVGLDATELQHLKESIFCPGPFYYYIVDFSTRECNYVHESVSSFFGVTPEKFSFSMIVNGIHPDDVPFVLQCEQMVHDFLFNKIDSDDITSYKINYCLRLKNKNNEYKIISHQALTLTTDSDNNIANVLNIHTDVSHLMSSSNRKISFLGLNGRPSFYKLDPFENSFESTPPAINLSKREAEVVRLAADGFSSKEIGGRLFISMDTVNTHRKNILQKSGCKNMAQVIARCVREAII